MKRHAGAVLGMLFLAHAAVAQFTQQGSTLVGMGTAGFPWRGVSVAISAEGNTAIVGGPQDNADHGGAAWAPVANGCTTPSITAQPQSRSVQSGQSATLMVAVTGGGTLSYQWFNGTSPGTGYLIMGATAASYTTLPLCVAVSYWVLVSSSCGSTNSNVATVSVSGGSLAFTYKPYLQGPESTLSASLQSLDSATGQVVINGVDSSAPSIPFTFSWGDGSGNDGWFPQDHSYTDQTRNYLISVTSHYTGGGTDQVQVVAFFTAPTVAPQLLPQDIAVTVPDQATTVQSRLPAYTVPTALTFFDDTYFPVLPRTTVQYVLSAAATIEKDFVNGNTLPVEGAFREYVLRDPNASGMYSLWYTAPVSLGAGNYSFQGSYQWSSFFHEMGHNFTLNMPASFIYGGKIDGNANAIYSEAMAQVFQHATAYELINNATTYGLGSDLAADIQRSAVDSMKVVRSSFDQYVGAGDPFSSWNDPSTPQDETLGTFMGIAYEFFMHAESDGYGYALPLRRMTSLLQLFDQDMANQYDALQNTAAAATFRATLMVAAVSYAFGEDLRGEFRNLNFPVDDQIFLNLYQTASTSACQPILIAPANLPDGSVGVGYNQTITAGGGTGPYTYSVTSGSLPAGLSLSSGGVLAGTPTTAGLFNFTVTAAMGDQGCTGSMAYSVTICTSPSIVSQPQSVAIAAGTTTTLSVTATGGQILTYQWYEGSGGTVATPVGTNSPTFTTPALTQTTSYWVRVSNPCGSADSAAATITVERFVRRHLQRVTLPMAHRGS